MFMESHGCIFHIFGHENIMEKTYVFNGNTNFFPAKLNTKR
jgi:hypothetical protein